MARAVHAGQGANCGQRAAHAAREGQPTARAGHSELICLVVSSSLSLFPRPHPLAACVCSCCCQDPKRLFEGAALLRRLTRLGLLSESEQKLDYCLGLSIEKFLDRRLQTRVFASGLALSIHHARCLIRQRHIRVGKRMVNVPSFMVRVESEKVIEFALTSPFGAGRPGRRKRKSLKSGGGAKEDKAEDEDM